ncbi:hypothetical protein P153DRAFT_321149 [Dothidotthia symphoricarpi CBS 119687]|uniref:Uncharacterized protein n=1 Tax=Dothidotthia symphoricarpi CBS 119687 TaxID=1392245 RepID=A0A6A6A676_9PLEO|nr:uncharacterized protein P153DRAFT_321149 [Dothidotthia symphoricarpi CBS 119687]KAF2127389.1 hypothetical protein P153DRAFT_321149 [Dothidotthia symphoricarpi CBS 119687]
MTSDPLKAPSEPSIPPLNFIYACSICCATFADVYEGDRETVQGLSDGINPKERRVSRLFLASCCHVFCGSHLEGGGPPFHPAGQRPQAPCPVCAKEKDDGEIRDLYSLRGLHKDECDPAIPAAWFVTPPIRLDGNGKEIEALRFQYVALIRYCQNTYASQKPLQDELAQTQKKLGSMQDLASAEHAEILELQKENERLRAAQHQFEKSQTLKVDMTRLQELEQEVEQYRRIEVDLRDFETFQRDKPAIKHYMKLVPMLIGQNEKMKDRLAKLGFAMALEPIPNFSGRIALQDEYDSSESADRPGTSLRKTTSSRTAGRSAHTASKDETARSSPHTQRPLKRQRLNSPLPTNMQLVPPSSRDAMPPPSKPMSRMRSMRKIFPSLRKKLSHSHSTPPLDRSCSADSDIQMYDNGRWQNTSASRAADDKEPPTCHGAYNDALYMSGALPVERSLRATHLREAGLFSNTRINGTSPNFTFRASSPVAMRKQPEECIPIHLPTEPSYIHLMDGLSRDTGMELGLKDPREATPGGLPPIEVNGAITNIYRDQRNSYDSDNRKPWGLGHAFLRQSPNCSAARVTNVLGTHQDDVRLSKTYNESNLNPVTPAPRRYQQLSHQVESVVSPFFKSSQHHSSSISKSRIAEPRDSSTYLETYRCPNRQPQAPESHRREPQSLNGLSFFDSPRNLNNEPIQYSRTQQPAEPVLHASYNQGRNLDSRGFITRPESGQSSCLGASAYGSSLNRPSYLRQEQTQSHSAIPFPPVGRLSYFRTGQLPSSMPSTIPGCSSVHSRPQWEVLKRMGVKSSRNSSTNTVKNTRGGTSRHLYTGSSRRSVRR